MNAATFFIQDPHFGRYSLYSKCYINQDGISRWHIKMARISSQAIRYHWKIFERESQFRAVIVNTAFILWISSIDPVWLQRTVLIGTRSKLDNFWLALGTINFKERSKSLKFRPFSEWLAALLKLILKIKFTRFCETYTTLAFHLYLSANYQKYNIFDSLSCRRMNWPLFPNFRWTFTNFSDLFHAKKLQIRIR